MLRHVNSMNLHKFAAHTRKYFVTKIVLTRHEKKEIFCKTSKSRIISCRILFLFTRCLQDFPIKSNTLEDLKWQLENNLDIET